MSDNVEQEVETLEAKLERIMQEYHERATEIFTNYMAEVTNDEDSSEDEDEFPPAYHEIVALAEAMKMRVRVETYKHVYEFIVRELVAHGEFRDLAMMRAILMLEDRVREAGGGQIDEAHRIAVWQALADLDLAPPPPFYEEREA